MQEPSKIYAAHRPRRSDVIHYKGKRFGVVERVEGSLCFTRKDGTDEALPFIWCFHDGLNNLHSWPAHDATKAAPGGESRAPTLQERMAATLAKTGIPHKEIKVFGSQVLITCWSHDAAMQFHGVLAHFCQTVRGPIESRDENQKNRNTVLRPTTHRVFRIGGTI